MGLDAWQREQIRMMEEALFETIDAPIHHVGDEITRDWDGKFVEGYTTNGSLPIVGRTYIPAGTVVELKTCQVWVDDAGSNGGRRRGRWQLSRDTHDVLEDEDGVYCLLVLDGERVVDGRVLPAEELNGMASWTNGGSDYSSERAIIPWAKVISPGSLD